MCVVLLLASTARTCVVFFFLRVRHVGLDKTLDTVFSTRALSQFNSAGGPTWAFVYKKVWFDFRLLLCFTSRTSEGGSSVNDATLFICRGRRPRVLSLVLSTRLKRHFHTTRRRCIRRCVACASGCKRLLNFARDKELAITQHFFWVSAKEKFALYMKRCQENNPFFTCLGFESPLREKL